MSKRILVFVLMAVMLTSLFGCTTPAQPTTSQAQPTTAAQAEQPTAVPATQGPPYMIDYYIVGNQDATTRPEVEKAINEYIQPLINANITFHIIGWSDWAGKAVTALEAGEKADIFFTADWEFYSKEVSEGLLTPLNDDKDPNGNLLAKYGEGITSSLNPAFLTGSAINGVNYAVPTNKELSVPWGFVYNATIADEIGFTDAEAAKIKTEADLEPWLAKVKAAHPDMYPYDTDGGMAFLQWQHGFSTISDLLVNQSAIPDANGKVDETLVSPIQTQWMADYLNVVRGFYTKQYIDPNAGLTTYDPMQNLNAGNFFISPMPLKGSNIKAEELMIASGNSDLKLKELYVTPKVINTSDAGGSMLAIPKTSNNPVVAMQLLNLMHTDKKLLNMMLYGVPEKMWTLESDGRVNLIDNNWYAANAGPWVWADVTLQYVTNKQDPTTNQKLIDYAKDAVPMPSLGFRFDPAPVNAEVTAVNSVVDGQQRALLTGSADPTTALPQYISDLKAAGLEKIIVEVQNQYAAWKAAKSK